MSTPVILTLRGEQVYNGGSSDKLELTTEGEMEYRDGGWDIRYQESELTGMEGVTTTFRVEDGCIVLQRSGRLRSSMKFREGVSDDSLYETDFGALMITITPMVVKHKLRPSGGTLHLEYAINIENSAAGFVKYHMKITRPHAS